MKQNQAFEKDIESIRYMMERSVKFLSLSGLSGILSGIYALVGATFAYVLLQYPQPPWQYQYVSGQNSMPVLIAISLMVLLASLITGYVMAARKAARMASVVADGPLDVLTMGRDAFADIVGGATEASETIRRVAAARTRR